MDSWQVMSLLFAMDFTDLEHQIPLYPSEATPLYLAECGQGASSPLSNQHSSPILCGQIRAIKSHIWLLMRP